jgi:hypothetical protein
MKKEQQMCLKRMQEKTNYETTTINISPLRISVAASTFGFGFDKKD